MPFKASAPGSLMLLGEYAVLSGKQALVCAIDKRISVTLTPHEDSSIEISSALGNYSSSSLRPIKLEKPFHFVLAALQFYETKLKKGCHIHIESNFSDTVGLGSSAAVTVATLAALATWLKVRVAPLDLIRQGRQIVRLIQGAASGADIAASVLGGVVSYQAQPLSAEKFSYTYPITAVYSGFKTPTAHAIKQVQHYFNHHPHLYRHIINSIGQCASEGIQQLRKQQWQKIGEMMNIQQGMMESLGVSMPLLRNLVEDLRQQDTVLGAKISGSGLGDCVIGLGQVSESIFAEIASGVTVLPVTMSLQGVQCEKI